MHQIKTLAALAALSLVPVQGITLDVNTTCKCFLGFQEKT